MIIDRAFTLGEHLSDFYGVSVSLKRICHLVA